MKTDITVVLDRSGSMTTIARDVVTGLNEFVRRQQGVEGEAWFTLVQFDDEYDVVHFRAPIADVPRLTSRTYVPRWSTALLDAIGRTWPARRRQTARTRSSSPWRPTARRTPATSSRVGRSSR